MRTASFSNKYYSVLLVGLTAVCLSRPCVAADAVIHLLNETVITGKLVSLDERQAVALVNGKQSSYSLEDVLRIEFPGERKEIQADYVVQLADGSHLRVKDFRFDAKLATIQLAGGVEHEIETSKLKSISRDSLTEVHRQTILKSKSEKDSAFIEKDGELHPLEGIVHGYDGAVLKFEWDGDDFPISKAKLAGLHFYRPQTTRRKALCQMEDRTGNKIWLKSCQLVNGLFSATSDAFTAKANVTELKSIDFSIGKVVQLSELEAASVRETPFFDIVWHYTKDKNLRGEPLRLNGKQYRRGLSLHSRCRITYAIGGEYKRFLADVGIDDSVGRLGHVVCQVIGDGKTLFASEIEGGQETRTLDLDVQGVRNLTLFVDFGERLDIGDRLNFADARLVR